MFRGSGRVFVGLYFYFVYRWVYIDGYKGIFLIIMILGREGLERCLGGGELSFFKSIGSFCYWLDVVFEMG